MKNIKYPLLVWVLLILFFASTVNVSAHPGRTDGNGGHNSPSGYHYHHGYPPHQHRNGECLYDFDDKTGQNSGNSSGKSSSGSTNKQTTGTFPQEDVDKSSWVDTLLSLLIGILVYFSFLLIPVALGLIGMVTEKIQKKRKEKKILIARQEFFDRLQGKSIRQFAKVPSYITFNDGLPVDNNNAVYGNFTVYRTTNGTKYHEKEGCCSARFPIHRFPAMSMYSPCSKCCRTNLPIPQWYNDYSVLRAEARALGIDVEE